MLQPIQATLGQEKLQQHLSAYQNLALEIGAKEAHIITTSQIVFDPRVTVRCRVPLCRRFGSNINCPPYAPPWWFMRQVVATYRFALIFWVQVPSERILAELSETSEDRKKIYQIVSTIESSAFYDGYYMAMGFAAGSCKSALCPSVPCQALEGKGCRYHARARPSMEAIGIDVFATVTALGWAVYPIGCDCKPEDVPYGTRVGLILIS